MNTFDPAEVRKAVAEFTPRRPQKFQDLIPAREVIVELHISRTLDEHDRDIYRAGRMSLREFALGADIEVNRARIFREGIVSIGGFLLFDWHAVLIEYELNLTQECRGVRPNP